MNKEIFAIAVVLPEAGHEDEVLSVLKDLYAVMTQKGYSRNILYRSAKDATLVNLRYWSSEEARSRAQEDPDVHRCWSRLGQLAKVEQVFPELDEVPIQSDPVSR